MFSVSEQLVAPVIVVRKMLGDVEMDALRVANVDSQVRNTLENLGSQMRDIRFAFQAAYLRWTSTTISIATYLSVVATVAVYDMILTVRYWQSLKEMEVNPIGRWLMNLDRIAEGSMPNLSLFIAMKSIGTIIVLLTIYALVTRRSRLGHPVAVGVTSFQLVLALYLTFDTNA